MLQVTLLEPWHPVSAERRTALESELARELPTGHVLSGKRATAIAARSDQDDVLFDVTGLGFAVVHLTWSGRQESSPQWPGTRLFTSLDEWAARVMVPAHREFSE